MLCLSDLPRDLWHSRVWTAHTIRTCRPLLVTMHGSERVQLTGGTGVWGLTVVAIGGMRRNGREEKGKERRVKKHLPGFLDHDRWSSVPTQRLSGVSGPCLKPFSLCPVSIVQVLRGEKT